MTNTRKLKGPALTKAIIDASETADSFDALARRVREVGDVDDSDLRRRVHYLAQGGRELNAHRLRDTFVYRNDDEWVRPVKEGRLFNEP